VRLEHGAPPLCTPRCGPCRHYGAFYRDASQASIVSSFRQTGTRAFEPPTPGGGAHCRSSASASRARRVFALARFTVKTRRTGWRPSCSRIWSAWSSDRATRRPRPRVERARLIASTATSAATAALCVSSPGVGAAGPAGRPSGDPGRGERKPRVPHCAGKSATAPDSTTDEMVKADVAYSQGEQLAGVPL
jgi:hypothetical protein